MHKHSRAFALVAVLLPSVLSARAAATSCDSVATVGAGVWEQYRKATELLGCKTPLGGSMEYALCGATRLVNESAEDVLGWWNRTANNRWATIGPRTLGAEVELGAVVKPAKRTFVSMVPTFNSGKIVVTGKSGTGRLTICATGPSGRTEKLVDDAEIAGDGTPREFAISSGVAAGKILGVVLDSKSPTFRYSIRKEEVPVRWNWGPITGLADLHTHGASDMGFAGLWTWGGHDGPQEEVLKRCRKLNVGDAVSLLAQIKGLPVLEKRKLHAIPIDRDNHEGETVVHHGSGWSNGVDRYDDWPHFSDIAHQQVHTDWLREAREKGLRLVVMSAVNNELLCRALRTALYQGDNRYPCDDMSNITRQLEDFNALDRKYDWYEIALTPWHARRIIREGKLAVVLAAEASHMLPPSEGALTAQLDKLYRLGLRSLQIVHERDNEFAGAAPHRSNFWPHEYTSNPLTAVKALVEGDGERGNPFDLGPDGLNRRGLHEPGRRLIEAMIQRRMLIDVSHFSSRTFDDVYSLVTSSRYGSYPLFASHSRFQSMLYETEADILKEFVTTDGQIERLRAVGGMVGLRTGANHIRPEPDSRVANTCPGSSRSYAQMVSYARARNINIAFGADFNGVTQQMGPRFGPERCYAAAKAQRAEDSENWAEPEPSSRTGRGFDDDGLKHIGYLPDLYQDLASLGTNGADALDRGAENFIVMWERAYETRLPVRVDSANACQVDADCGAGRWCDGGLDLRANVCRAKLASGEVCGKIGELGVGHRCLSGDCKVGGLVLKCR